MSDMKIQQSLAEMQALATQAKGLEQTAEAGKYGDFADMLKQAIDGVNAQQIKAGELSEAFVRGEDVSLTDVVVAGQKSRIAFEAVKQVRNHVLEAYQEVSRMQI
ncbi:flagellar hook-basal body complex protein FliE [Alkalilimnicola ehrlichii]|uniref:Flagellar hook-basal body complex protein FliE n=1 Tax=Alkalilimnicola ehrlichii TaxID=351052 RepID=A0A3E0WS82_9GAMM|nr:flagellar hook-basal body complex protein FliE [Alkalilimnicola ehrlichii]RFA28545.1 flagellar hook-basal body complex protein FliE [Alkalilimnicola ehrlichii]RFA35708.1 flagellar hook-basal body complex protein FliE [Alkalilimnicola ehrlichii]